jgi:hypothetical protein
MRSDTRTALKQGMERGSIRCLHADFVDERMKSSNVHNTNGLISYACCTNGSRGGDIDAGLLR